MIKHAFFYLLIVSTILCACTKPPDFPPEPIIEFGGIMNSNVQQNQDSVFFTVKFTDGDGDIGSSNNEIKNLFLIDKRPSQFDYVTELVMPMVTELGSDNGISGEISFSVVPCCVAPSDLESCLPIPPEHPEFAKYQRDTLVYEMYIEDRAGNKSNIITLEPIYLLCD